MQFEEFIKQSGDSLVALRRDIHAHPELAFEENRTAELVAARLEGAGLEVHRGWAKTGVVAVLRAGSGGRSIGLRADMDALPIHELNPFEHCSTHTGKMHACGHDGHTAMLVGAAEYLARNPDFNGTVVFFFQPAEEGEGGARVMIEEGVLERFPVDAVFGLHNWPGMPEGQMGVHTGPVMACADRFDIVIHGNGGHAAMPHQANDVVVAGSALVQALQTVVSRTRDPLTPAVLSVTRFHAGEANNVLADTAVLGGTVRAFSNAERDRIEAAMQQQCRHLGAAYGVKVELDYRRGYPPTVNSAAEAGLCAEVAACLLGRDNVRLNMPPSMGAEDFAYFLERKPGCYVWLANGMAEGGCMLHNPRYDFNDAVLPLGVRYWVELVHRFLALL